MEPTDKQQHTNHVSNNLQSLFHVIIGWIMGLMTMAILIGGHAKESLKLGQMSSHDSIVFDLDRDLSFHTRFYYVLGAMKDSTMIVTVSKRK